MGDGQIPNKVKGEYHTELASEEEHDSNIMTSSRVHSRVLREKVQIPEVLSWPSIVKSLSYSVNVT